MASATLVAESKRFSDNEQDMCDLHPINSPLH